VKVGQSPWQGYDRALNHTFAYLGWYSAAGMGVFMGFSLLLPYIGQRFLEIFLLHLGTVPIMLPGAFLVNFMGLRRWPSRTWRTYPARARQAALLALLAVWIGLPASVFFGVEPSETLEGLIGVQGAWILHYCGLVVVLSTAALAVVWCVPPSRRP
jgi:hypothetical protein